jgi:DNA-directed RNA polymerase specialized sigma24 family protein
MAAPGAWLHRVAINLSTSHFRRRKAERAAAERSNGLRQGGADREEHADVLAVRRELLSLPIRQRTALVLRYYGDLSVDDTAAAMRCRPGTVKALTSQGLSTLRTRGFSDLEEQSHA